jgi:hypothetical protein
MLSTVYIVIGRVESKTSHIKSDHNQSVVSGVIGIPSNYFETRKTYIKSVFSTVGVSFFSTNFIRTSCTDKYLANYVRVVP